MSSLEFAPQRYYQRSNFDESIPASHLQWGGATDEQLAFMRQVYERHVTRAEQRRTFLADVPSSDLATIELGYCARTQAAAACRNLLAEARAALAQQQQQSDSQARTVQRLSVVSAYRSASEQFSSWQRNFPRYYHQTETARAALSGGSHGEAAIAYLVQYIGGRLAAPGYSLHNNGLAIDFGTRENGRSLGADYNSTSIDLWRRSWFFNWLTSNAVRFNYYQNTSINEPWHWEYREPIAQPTQSYTEAVTISAGREELSNVPLLRDHRGTQPNLILRWNDMNNPTIVDVVVHLHGYSDDRDHMVISRAKEPYSGFENPDNAGDLSLGRSRPTLGILPRGNYFGGDSGKGYDFPALVTREGLQDLIDFSFEHFSRGFGITLSLGRLILTAHSGGGAALIKILRHNDPHEVHVFDALYQDATHLTNWAKRRIQQDINTLEAPVSLDPQQYMREQGGALRVFYRPGTRTQSYSRAVHRAIAPLIPAVPKISSILSDWYRVEQTSIAHGEIPRRYGWRLLSDASANLPSASPL